MLDTFPASVTGMERDGGADYAKHPLISARKDYEFGGPGDDVITLSGELMPFHIGGLSEIELAHALRDSGEPQYLVRGDGRVYGWHVIVNVNETHSFMSANGVGSKVEYKIKAERCGEAGESVGSMLMASILTLFG